MTTRTPTRSIPWRISDLLVLYVGWAIGFGLLLVAWWGASSTAVVADQMPWINVGAVGVMAIGTGNCVWLLNGRRTLGERRTTVLGRFDPGVRTDTAEDTGTRARVVAANGMRRYHRPDCILVQGKPVSTGSPARHQRAGREPCGVCRP